MADRKGQREGLNPRQSRFVAEYLVDLNGTQAAIRAGYSDNLAAAEVQASRLLGNAKVKAAIDKALAARERRVEVKADDVLRELLRIATCDIRQAFKENGELKPIHEIPEDVARALAAIETDELFDGFGKDKAQVGVTRKLKFWDKPRALELLGKHLKLYTDKVEHSGGLLVQVVDPYAKPAEGDGG